jgi:hypothetical protein
VNISARIRSAESGADSSTEEAMLDLLQHLLLHRLHPQHPLDDVDRDVLGQFAEHARGVIRFQLRQDHRDRLRIFVAQIGGEHGFADVRQLVPHRPPRGAANILHDLAYAVVGQDPRQQPLGRLERPVQPVHAADLARKRDQQVFGDGGGHAAELRHRRGEVLDLLDRQMLPHRCAVFLAQHQHQRGGPLGTGIALHLDRLGRRDHHVHRKNCSCIGVYAQFRPDPAPRRSSPSYYRRGDGVTGMERQ